MAVLTTFKVNGEPDDLLAKKHEVIDPVFLDEGRANGLIEHVVVKTDDGLMMVNLWETLEGSEQTADKVRPVAEEAGLARPTDWTSYEIVQREGG
jgi:hypothetical protein